MQALIRSINRLSRFTGFFIGLGLLGLAGSAAAEFDHSAWDELLKDHVVEFARGSKTAVDYGAMGKNREQLQSYLSDLAEPGRDEFDTWGRDSQLAFLINAYNAWTVELILGYYPDIDSIRDIGFLPGAAWRRGIVSLFGRQVSLDELEHEMIRQWPQFREPRIHFAVNCAAIGCPALRAEAYTGARLDEQLQDSTWRFLADRDRNWLQGDSLYVSRIFDWYEDDFQQGWQGINSVQDFLIRFADALALQESDIKALQAGDIRIRYSRYDWGLNDLESRP